ncbi:MAG TPA: KTSC domain-containing protein [Candidatus Saccharimonadales bacterium]|jgi:hypothetical protein|nr:KTSC domain-containing protein [Candidatus Saccharimonadales bacterium]
MDRLLVNSTNIITVGYDADSKTLEVEFQSGKIYQYSDVPEDIYQELMAASSKGQFFHDNVMNQYDFTEV